MRLANKITVITGGNSGIGLATARLFAAEGARVAIIGRNAKTLNAAATELGAGVLAVRADVTDGDATKQAMVEIADKLVGSTSCSPTRASTKSRRSAKPHSPTLRKSSAPTSPRCSSPFRRLSRISRTERRSS